MFYVYILKSINSNHYYIGHTANLKKRLVEHNSRLVKSAKRYLPWKVVYSEQFDTKAQAYRRELQVKSYKGGNAFKELINL